jgi:hypothetical protein
MKRKNCETVRKNINLGHFKDTLIQYLISIRAISGEIVDIDFGLPSKGCVPLEIYIKAKEKDEDQVVEKKRGKK